MIIDAKYKNYTRFGRTAEFGIQREDLYQMSTYLYHYGKENQTITGIFTSPVQCIDNDIHTYSGNKNHKIGLVNMNIVDAHDDISLIHEYEDKYINKIRSLLK